MTLATTTQFYATIAEADTFLYLKHDWLVIEQPIKEGALLEARYFIDLNFDCVIDYLNIPEEIKHASAILAYDFFSQGELFFSNKRGIKSKKVEAKGVLVDTNFGHSQKDKPNSLNKVISILKPICNYSKSNLKRA